MLLAVIAIVWLVVTALCVAVCMAARRGDAGADAELSSHTSDARATRRQSGRSATGEGLIVWEGLPELSVQARDARLTAHSAR